MYPFLSKKWLTASAMRQAGEGVLLWRSDEGATMAAGERGDAGVAAVGESGNEVGALAMWGDGLEAVARSRWGRARERGDRGEWGSWERGWISLGLGG